MQYQLIEVGKIVREAGSVGRMGEISFVLDMLSLKSLLTFYWRFSLFFFPVFFGKHL